MIRRKRVHWPRRFFRKYVLRWRKTEVTECCMKRPRPYLQLEYLYLTAPPLIFDIFKYEEQEMDWRPDNWPLRPKALPEYLKDVEENWSALACTFTERMFVTLEPKSLLDVPFKLNPCRGELNFAYFRRKAIYDWMRKFPKRAEVYEESESGYTPWSMIPCRAVAFRYMDWNFVCLHHLMNIFHQLDYDNKHNMLCYDFFVFLNYMSETTRYGYARRKYQEFRTRKKDRLSMYEFFKLVRRFSLTTSWMILPGELEFLCVVHAETVASFHFAHPHLRIDYGLV